MGILSFLFGGVATNTLIDRLNPPTIVFRNTNYVCKGISPSGYDKWMFAYGKRNNTKRTWIKLNKRITFIDEVGGIDIYWN
jgi:hypothetical protein